MTPSAILGLALQALVVGALVVVATRWLVRTFIPAKKPVDATETDRVLAPAVPYRDGAPSVLEAREQHVRERAAIGLCVHCSSHATHPFPVVRVTRSWADPVLLYLGAEHAIRWRVVVWTEGPITLCAAHGSRWRALLEKEVADRAAEYAAFKDKQHREVHDFQTARAFEVVDADTQALHTARKPARAKTPPPLVVVPRSANGGVS